MQESGGEVMVVNDGGNDNLEEEIAWDVDRDALNEERKTIRKYEKVRLEINGVVTTCLSECLARETEWWNRAITIWTCLFCSVSEAHGDTLLFTC